LTRGLDPPAGDPDALAGAARQLRSLAEDLGRQEGTLRTGFSTALAEWHGARGEDFRRVSGGVQVIATSAGAALSEAADSLSRFADALRDARTTVASLASQAGEVQAGSWRRSGYPAWVQPTTPDLLRQANLNHARMECQAQAVHDDLRQFAVSTARRIADITDLGLPGSSTMSPQDIARRVQDTLGTTGLSAGGAQSLTADQAWQVLGPAADAVPAEDVDSHGEPLWDEIIAALGTPVNGPVTAWTAGTTPQSGWALYELAHNAAVVQTTNASVLRAADAVLADAPAGDTEALIRAASRLEQIGYAADAFDPAQETPGLVRAAGAGGLPESALLTDLGRFFAVAGIASDALTVISPDGDGAVEQNVNRSMAVLNAGATVTLLATAGSVSWVPVVGQVVVLATGLWLAGDWVYNSYKHGGWAKTAADATGNFITSTIPAAVGSAASSAADWIGDLFS
jgi:hypothetical protein